MKLINHMKTPASQGFLATMALILLAALPVSVWADTTNYVDSAYALPYTGPADSTAFSNFLATSTAPAITSLDAGTKASLVQYLAFSGGLPRGLSGSDQNIQNLYQSGGMQGVLEALYGTTVYMRTNEIDQYITLDQVTALGATLERSCCENCRVPEPNEGVCCIPPDGFGCEDDLAFSGSNIYRVDVSYPEITAASSLTIYAGQSIPLGQPPAAGYAYSWSPATGLSATNVANPIASPTNTITYTFVVAASPEITVTNQVTVTVLPATVTVVDSAYALPYTGPADSTAFSNFLYTSTESAITNLDADTKASLLQYVVFRNGLPRGMSGSDQNIQNLKQSGGTQGVLEALYGTTVYMRTNEIDQYLTLDQVAAVGAIIEPSCCLNCRVPQEGEGVCCIVESNECEDELAFSGTNIYRVDVPYPAITAVGSLTIYSGQSVPLGQQPAAGYAYSWSPATGLSATNVANPIASPTNTITYTFVVAASPEITVTNQVTVTVLPATTVNPVDSAYALPYTGPADSTAFSNFLFTSTAPAITNLDAGTKASLLQYVVFRDGLPRGMSGSDQNIQNLKQSGGTQGVLEALYGTTVYMRTNEIDQYLTLDQVVALGAVIEPSCCLNCRVPQEGEGVCCIVESNECEDELAFSGTNIYRVDVPFPGAFAGSNLTIYAGQSIPLGQPPAAGYAYSWSPATGLSATNVANPIASPTNTTTYTFVVAASPEITVTNQVTITVLPVTSENVVDSAYALPYTGPANSAAFSNFLATSSAPAITSLNASTKASLVQYLVFSGGLPRGMSGTDQNIQNLYQSGEIQGVLEALYGTMVYVRTNEIDQFLTLDQAVTLDADIEPSCCLSCYYTNVPPCCRLGGDGCEDDVAFVGTNVYRLDIPFPVSTAVSSLTIYSGQSVPLGQPPVAGYTYSWSPATGLSATDVANPTASPTTTTTYTFVVAASPEAMVTNQVTITVLPATVTVVDSAYGMPYTGPAGSTAFSNFLFTSTASAITNLDAGTKASLLQNLVFRDGLPRGMSNIDQNIQNLVQSGGMQGVLDALYGTTVYLRTNEIDQYLTLDQVIELGANIEPSCCLNCRVPQENEGVCCIVDTGECEDELAFSGTNVYRVDVLSPVAFAGSNLTIYTGQSVPLGQPPAAGYAYSWSPATGLSATNVANPIASPTTTTTYTFVVAASPEITVTNQVTITVLPATVTVVDSAYALPYTGPANSATFSNFLATSTAPAITGLDAATKASLVQYLAFSGGLPRGMSGIDQNIQNLYQSGGIQGVLNALYGTTVYLRTNQIDQYLTLDQVAALGANIEPSCCENCREPNSDEGQCCVVGGDGCEDELAFSGTNVYRVDVPFPVAFAGSNLTIYAGQSVPLGQPPAAGYVYSWSPATGLSATNVANPTASPTKTTTYTFIVAASPEITVTNQVTITVAVPTLALKPAGPNFTISWPANDSNAVLQEANTILGPWSNVIGSTNPWSITPTGGATFFRLHQ